MKRHVKIEVTEVDLLVEQVRSTASVMNVHQGFLPDGSVLKTILRCERNALLRAVRQLEKARKASR